MFETVFQLVTFLKFLDRAGFHVITRYNTFYILAHKGPLAGNATRGMKQTVRPKVNTSSVMKVKSVRLKFENEA